MCSSCACPHRTAMSGFGSSCRFWSNTARHYPAASAFSRAACCASVELLRGLRSSKELDFDLLGRLGDRLPLDRCREPAWSASIGQTRRVQSGEFSAIRPVWLFVNTLTSRGRAKPLCLPYTGLAAALRSLSSVALSSAASQVSLAQAECRPQLVTNNLNAHLIWGIPNQRF
jgi:hypothetical protein